MKYSIIEAKNENNRVDVDLQIGDKSKWINANIEELNIPKNLYLKQEIRKNASGTEIIWISLYGEDIADTGDYGFVVSSPNKEIEPVTCALAIKSKSNNT